MLVKLIIFSIYSNFRSNWLLRSQMRLNRVISWFDIVPLWGTKVRVTVGASVPATSLWKTTLLLTACVLVVGGMPTRAQRLLSTCILYQESFLYIGNCCKHYHAMSKLMAIGIATLTVILNGLIDHFFAPNGIMLTPVVLVVTSLLVAFGTKRMDLLLVSFLTFLFVALNDISIKLFGGGSHDIEGQGWIHFLLFIGLIPAIAILLAAVFKRKEEPAWKKIVVILMFCTLVAVYLQLSRDLGLGRYYWYRWNG